MSNDAFNKNIKLKVCVLVFDQDRLLLIKEKQVSTGQYKWNLVKGTFEPDVDTDIIFAAERECYEEIGCKPVIKDLYNIVTQNKSENFVVQYNFIAQLGNEVPKLHPKEFQEKLEEDIIEIKFFSREDLNNLKEEDFIQKRTFLIIKDYLSNPSKIFPLNIITKI